MSVIEQNTNVSGFRPEVYVVAPSSYVKNNTYGSGAPLLSSLLVDGFQLSSGAFSATSGTGFVVKSQARIRQQDSLFSFDLEVDLNLGTTGAASGYTGTGEIRIRPAGGVGASISGGAVGLYRNDPPTYHKQLAHAYEKPYGARFKDVFLIDAYTGLELLPTGTAPSAGSLEAQLLQDGSLALVNRADATGAATPANNPLLVSQLFGLVSASRVVRIVIRGTYLANPVVPSV